MILVCFKMYRRSILRCLTSNVTATRTSVKTSYRSYCVARSRPKLSRIKTKPHSNENPNSLSAVAQLFLNEDNFKTVSYNEHGNPKTVIAGKKPCVINVEDDTESEAEESCDFAKQHEEEENELDIKEEDLIKDAEGELDAYMEDIIAVQNVQISEQTSIAEQMKAIKSGTPNPKIPMSDVSCQGCGAFFHCKDASIPGYLPSERFVTLTKQQLRLSLCQRCNLMYNYDICLNVKSTEEEFKRIISTINQEISLILLVVDLTDIRNSLMSGLFSLLKKQGRPIYIVGNKIDSIPMDETGYLKRIRTILFEECEKVGLNPSGRNIKNICVVSAKTGYGIENLVSHLMVNWKYNGNVYLLGNTNVGKSTLFNALLQSDYCKSRAREIIHRATVSVWPGTTISTLKFPILNPKPWRLAMREKRIKIDKTALQEERILQKSMVQQEEHLRSKWKSATLSGYLGVTDFQEDVEEIRKYENPSFEMKHGSLVCNTGRDKILSLPKGIEFDDIPAKQSNWLFDTPGVINQEQTINLMTPTELASILPTEVVPPRVYLLKPGQSMFITAFGRIDYIEGQHSIFMTVHVTSQMKVHIKNEDEADEFYKVSNGKAKLQVPVGGVNRLENIPALVGREFYLPKWIGIDRAIADIQLSSLGWVSVTKYKDHPIRLQAYTPGGRGLYLREPALLPNIKTFRGKRIGGKQEYRVKPPKMS